MLDKTWEVEAGVWADGRLSRKDKAWARSSSIAAASEVLGPRKRGIKVQRKELVPRCLHRERRDVFTTLDMEISDLASI